MTNHLPTAHSRITDASAPAGLVCALSYEDRFLRRKVLQADCGARFLVDFAHTESLDDGDLLPLSDGRAVRIRARAEPLMEVRGPDLARLAWHIGNRHTPCRIEPDRLLIQRDHVMRDMLTRIGAELRDVVEPFTPEGGAYGHGRTHGHDHSHSHGPDNGHASGHGHAHPHSHSHSHADGHSHGDGHSHAHGPADHAG